MVLNPDNNRGLFSRKMPLIPKIALNTFIAGEVADGITTHFALQKGGQESTPWLHDLIQTHGEFSSILARLAIIGIVSLGTSFLTKRRGAGQFHDTLATGILLYENFAEWQGALGNIHTLSLLS